MPDSPPRSALRAQSACVHTCVYGTCRGPSCTHDYSSSRRRTAASRSPAPVYMYSHSTLKTQLAESSKDWTWTSTRSLTPVGQLESCSKHLRVLRERSHCQSGSTKRIPKRVRVRLSRTSRTDEAAERCRLHERGPLSLEAARDGAFSDVFFGRSLVITSTHSYPPPRSYHPSASCTQNHALALRIDSP